MTGLFIDSGVVLYALGRPSELRSSCAAVVTAAVEGRCVLHLSVEAVQEVVFHRMRRVSRGAALQAGRELSALAVLHPFDEDVLRRSLVLIESSPIRGRDAVHAATAQALGFESIVSADSDFAVVPGLAVVPPSEALGSLGRQ
ncbi:type II toxin-antitoxin system VapC family toxin [Nocardioides sp. C4-1]|uniref:type II toxin-antitoxin system VapC family toxin n=1 Tax=Nocardioides sp. C4-1 TaxID=3151851 RepID=UPI003263A7B0